MLETRPLVSVCCTTYNHNRYVLDALQSIVNQDYPNIEIRILDDGSTDGTIDLLENFKKKSNRDVFVTHQANTGRIGENANKVIANARGDFVMLMSLDDVMYPDIISKLLPLMIASDRCALVTSTSRTEINEDGEVILCEQNAGRFGERTDEMFQFLNKEDLKKRLFQEQHGGSFGVSDSMYRRSLLSKVGGFDNDMLGDDIVLRVKILKFMIENSELKMALIPYPVIQYRKHSTNIHRDSERQCAVLYEVLQRYFEAPDLSTLNSWIRITIMRAYRKGEVRKFLRLVFFDKKNQSRLQNLLSILPLMIRDGPIFIFTILKKAARRASRSLN